MNVNVSIVSSSRTATLIYFAALLFLKISQAENEEWKLETIGEDGELDERIAFDRLT